VNAETAGIKVTGDGGEDSIRNVTKAIESAVGVAQSDGRREWQRIAAGAGLSGESYFVGYKDAWVKTKLAEYAPLIAANADAALELRAAERAANEKETVYQNSAPYKIRKFLDVPFDVAAFGISAAAATDVTTGTAVAWTSWNNGGGLGLVEVSLGERAIAGSILMLGPVGRGAGFVDDMVRTGLRGRSFAGTAARPWVAKMIRHGPLNPGPLADDVANTFRSGSYTARTLDQPTILYRVIGDSGNPAGSYWTATKPKGPLQSVIDSALDQNWGNSATTVIRAQVPAGTRIYEGAAAAQRGLVGGGNQIYIPKVDPKWITP
jgi:hypothetical protein